MHRREFLRGAARTLLVLPFGTFLVHCSEDEEAAPLQPDGTPPDAPPRVEEGNVVYTSNKVKSHSHNFVGPGDALATPPEEGLTGNTSSTDGHSHSFEITRDALVMASEGQEVILVTGTASGHAHTFRIVKV